LSYTVALRGKSQLSLNSGAELTVKPMFKYPLAVSRDLVLGWIEPHRLEEGPEEPLWKRLPEIVNLQSTQMSSKYNLALLFRQPVKLPALKVGGMQVLETTRKQSKQGIWVDGVVLQAEDVEKATRSLSAWGIPAYQSRTDALTDMVGIELDPQAAGALEAERSEIRRKQRSKFYLLTRLAAAAVLAQMSVKMWAAGESAWSIISTTALAAAFAGLFALVYRKVRFGFGAPAGGRNHRRVLASMAPFVVAGFAGLLWFQRTDCLCSLPAVLQPAAFWAFMAWGGGAMAAGLGFLGIKQPVPPDRFGRNNRPGTPKTRPPMPSVPGRRTTGDAASRYGGRSTADTAKVSA